MPRSVREHGSKDGPTRAYSPTPLRGHKIKSILTRGFSSNVVAIYRGGAADAQAVGPRHQVCTMLAQLAAIVLAFVLVYHQCLVSYRIPLES